MVECIDEAMRDGQDPSDVAIASQSLVSVEGPNLVPGPVGGGRMPLSIASQQKYLSCNSVGLLQAHVDSVSIAVLLAFHSLLHLGWLITGS